ncbi:hypothetical protein QL285_080716 [Trifolium repens]|nr:hypothetical protein QL285_080716 [Trifolium repens]
MFQFINLQIYSFFIIDLKASNSFSDSTFVQPSPSSSSASFNQVSDSFFAEIHPSALFNLQSRFKIQGTSSSTVHVDLNAEEIQGPQEIQGLREIQGPRCASRIRKPPTCGTHQRLGKK